MVSNVDYFIKGCKMDLYKQRDWVYSVFNVVELPDANDEKNVLSPDNYDLKLYHQNGKVVYLSRDDEDHVEGTFHPILLNGNPIPYPMKEPILYVNEGIEITPEDIESLRVPKLLTTPGKFFLNYYCFIYGVGKHQEYVNDDNIDVGKYISKLAEKIVDDPLDSSKRSPDVLYCSDFKRTIDSTNAISAFSTLYTPSATYYTMTSSPDAKKVRDALFEKYKDKLDDPLTVIDIEKEIIKADEKYIDQDPNKGFYISRKSIDLVRKKLHYTQGMQVRMDSTKPMKLVKRALTEPVVDYGDVPAEIDGIRHGSFSRGKMTALGGEGAKLAYRIFSSSVIIKEDCGTKLGRRIYIPAKYQKNFIGGYIIEDGKTIQVTSENIGKYVDKFVTLRTPAYCRADPSGRGYCLKCFGEKLRGHEKSLAAVAVGVPQTMNGRFMKAMHVDAPEKKPILLKFVII